jgi:hypothetical protein
MNRFRENIGTWDSQTREEGTVYEPYFLLSKINARSICSYERKAIPSAESDLPWLRIAAISTAAFFPAHVLRWQIPRIFLSGSGVMRGA